MKTIRNRRFRLDIKTICFLSFALFMACTARIDITTDDAPERLVVYGYITNDTMRHSIRITRSASYFATTPPVGISGAEVTIRTDDNEYKLTESLSEPGVYLTKPNVYGVEGKTYYLHLAVDFDGDGVKEVFEADSYMPYSAEIDSITLVQSLLFDDMIEMQLYGKRPPNERNFLNIRGYKNGVVVNDSLSGFVVLDDKHTQLDRYEALPCFMFDQEEEERVLTPGDTIKLRLNVLTKEYADFMWNAREELGGSNPIFGGPPANVETNIMPVYNPKNVAVSGFFTAFSGSEATRVFEGLE